MKNNKSTRLLLDEKYRQVRIRMVLFVCWLQLSSWRCYNLENLLFSVSVDRLDIYETVEHCHSRFLLLIINKLSDSVMIMVWCFCFLFLLFRVYNVSYSWTALVGRVNQSRGFNQLLRLVDSVIKQRQDLHLAFKNVISAAIVHFCHLIYRLPSAVLKSIFIWLRCFQWKVPSEQSCVSNLENNSFLQVLMNRTASWALNTYLCQSDN